MTVLVSPEFALRSLLSAPLLRDRPAALPHVSPEFALRSLLSARLDPLADLGLRVSPEFALRSLLSEAALVAVADSYAVVSPEFALRSLLSALGGIKLDDGLERVTGVCAPVFVERCTRIHPD